MRRHSLARIGVVILAAIAAALPASADGNWDKTYSVSGKPTLRVQVDDARVRILDGPAGKIQIHLAAQGWEISDLQIIESQSGNSVELTVREPHFNIGWHARRSISLEITVPASSDLNVSTGDGNIEASNISGAIRLHTGDGNVRLTRLHGELQIETSDGDVNADRLDGRVSVHTGDGSVRLTGRFELLDLHSGDGRIEADADAGSKLAGPWSLRSGDGDITLRFADDLGAELDAQTGDGRIQVDFPVTVSGGVRESRLHGKIFNGGPELRIRTGDGSIRLSHVARPAA